MPDSLDSVRVLYKEPRPDGTMPTSESLSDAARAEVAALAPLKAALDARPTSAPDTATIAAVLEAARAAAAPPMPRAADRDPVRRSRRSRFRVAMPVLAVCACVAIGLAMIAQQGEPLADAGTAASEPIAAVTPPADDPSPAPPAAAATPTVETPTAEPPTAEPLTAETLTARAPVAAVDEAVANEAPTSVPTDPARGVDPARAADAAAPIAADDIAGESAPAAASRVSAPVSSQPGLRLASTASSSAVTAWDTPSDEELRLLSLRLQALRESNQGLAWDEPPVALSAPATETLRAPDLVSDTAHDETRVGFHATPPPRTGFIRVQPRGQ
ncbi:MAG: hypothetical protein AAF624_17350 [Bacteroidota bacterium]